MPYVPRCDALKGGIVRRNPDTRFWCDGCLAALALGPDARPADRPACNGLRREPRDDIPQTPAAARGEETKSPDRKRSRRVAAGETTEPKPKTNMEKLVASQEVIATGSRRTRAALEDEMGEHIHALAMRTLTPEQDVG